MSAQPFDEILSACTGLDDPTYQAAAALADAWGPALAASYRLGRADGYAAGRWDTEHEYAERWHAVAEQVQRVLKLPTQDELRARRGERAA